MAVNELKQADIKPKYEIVEHNGKPARKYGDGSIRNEKGQVMVPSQSFANLAITSDTAHDMIRLREEKRNRLYAEGAQLSVQNRALIAKYGDDAHIVERAMTLQTIASTPDAGKAAVMADQQLQKAQGYDVKDGGQVGDTLGVVADVLRSVAEFARMLDVIPMRKDNVVDADVQEEQ